MKYLTKERYETMHKSSFHLNLRVSQKAEVFSEDYFRKLYKREEKAWLRLQEDVSKVQVEDIFPEDFQVAYVDGYPLEPSEIERVKKEYLELRERMLVNYLNRPAFDYEQEKKNFKKALQLNVIHLKRNLPVEIQQKIADIRVLALNRVSADIKKELTAYCKANRKAVESAVKAYWKEYKKRFRNGEPAFAEKFNFHDCTVISCRKKGNDTVITLDSGGYTNIKQVIFKNCLIIKQDTSLRGAWWLYNEIYKTGEGFEIHILLQKKELIDFIVSVTDVEYK